jgi:hypothetical protein
MTRELAARYTLEHGAPRFESCHRLAKLAANRPGLATHSPERYSMLGVHAEADWEARSYTCSGNNF